MLAKAGDVGADAVIVDLEDSVPWSEKASARTMASDWLADCAVESQIWIRVNNHPDALQADLEVAKQAPPGTVDGIVLAKAETCLIIDEITLPVIGLIESGTGWINAAEIAHHASVVGLGCGEADLVADLGMTPSEDERELIPFRMDIVAACASAKIPPPTGPVWTSIADLDGLTASSDRLRRMGFGARSAIHPGQLATINKVFSPSEADIAWATAITEQSERAGGGVFVDDQNKMVDEAIVRRARTILERRI